jgi:hypothetical protein
MAVRALRSQEAQHDSGAIVRSAGREAVQFELDGRTMTIDVERGIGSDLFFLPVTLKWDDGELVTADVAERIRPIITEVERFWGLTAEFRSLPA